MIGSNAVLAQRTNVQTLPLSTNAKQLSKLPRHKIDELIVEHREHGKRLAWSFLTGWRIRMHQDEVMSVVGVALCEAANRFDIEKGVAFKTFFFYHLRGMLLKEITRAIQEQKVLQYMPHTVVSDCSNTDQLFLSRDVFTLVENNNPERIIQKRQLSLACWHACAQLDPLEREVLIRYFVYDEPLIKIANELNYCRCHISRVKSRAMARVAKILKSSSGQQLSDEGFQEIRYRNGRLSVKRVSEARCKSYTGGRGRRKTKKAMAKAAALEKLRRAAG
jgi:RNA polymerase sigma factor (sigma-70 family)